MHLVSIRHRPLVQSVISLWQMKKRVLKSWTRKIKFARDFKACTSANGLSLLQFDNSSQGAVHFNNCKILRLAHNSTDRDTQRFPRDHPFNDLAALM